MSNKIFYTKAELFGKTCMCINVPLHSFRVLIIVAKPSPNRIVLLPIN